MAIGAYRYAHEHDIHIPQELSIIGFDDIRLAVYTNPPLTTICQSKDKMGSRAAELLLGRIANQDLETRQEIIDVQLMVRDSTAHFSHIVERAAS